MPSLTQCIKAGNGDGKPGWSIKFDYNVDLIEDFKKAIHHTGREWRKDSKSWWVSEDYEDVLDEFFSNWHSLAKRQGSLL